jgi:hypothetical protein
MMREIPLPHTHTILLLAVSSIRWQHLSTVTSDHPGRLPLPGPLGLPACRSRPVHHHSHHHLLASTHAHRPPWSTSAAAAAHRYAGPAPRGTFPGAHLAHRNAQLSSAFGACTHTSAANAADSAVLRCQLQQMPAASSKGACVRSHGHSAQAAAQPLCRRCLLVRMRKHY